MTSQPSPRDRARRRDRALALRRTIKVVAGAGGLAGVGLVGYLGYLGAAGAPTKTATQAVSVVRTVTTVITVGEDGVISKRTTTTLSPGTATTGAATSAVTVSGGSPAVKKP